MASIMNFIRTTSGLSNESYSQQQPQQLGRTESKMARASSFNDLSCGASRDAESEYIGPRSSDSLSHRSSLDTSGHPGSSLESRSSMDAMDYRSTLLGRISSGLACAGRRASIGVSPAVDIPGATAEAPQAFLQQSSCPPTAPKPPQNQKRQTGKIDGMDYHEWADLLRSSSL